MICDELERIDDVREHPFVNFNILFKMKSWQSVLAADVGAAINRSVASAGEERRINLIGYDASLEHMLLSVGARNRGQTAGTKHLITGASARLTVSAAPDIQLNAGVSNFWQKRQTSPDSLGSRVQAAAQD